MSEEFPTADTNAGQPLQDSAASQAMVATSSQTTVDIPSQQPPTTTAKRTRNQISETDDVSTLMAPPKKKRGLGKSVNKENVLPSQPSADASVATSQPVPKPAPRKKKVEEVVVVQDDLLESLSWSKAEKGKLFLWFLDQNDDDHEKRFALLTNNRAEAYRKAARTLFQGTRTDAAVKSQYERARQVYSWIKEYNRFTGNGGGDGDEVEDDGDDGQALRLSMSTRKIAAARKAGKFLGSLNAKLVVEWEDEGWFDLFNAKYSSSPSVSLVDVRSSMSLLSDDDSTPEPERIRTGSGADRSTSAPAKPTPAKTTPARIHRENSLLASANINEFLERRAEAESKRALALEMRAEREHEREVSRLALERDRYQLELRRDQREETAQKFLFADRVMSNANMSAAVKQAAEAYILRQLALD